VFYCLQKLQVLNTFIPPSLFLRFNSGWPEMCYYKVDVTFESRDAFPEPGLYRQSIVFDFKRDPKLVRHICVEVLPKIEPIENTFSEVNVHKSVWATSRPVESPIFSLSGDLNNLLVTGEEKDTFTSKNCDFPSLDQYASSSLVSELPVKGASFECMDIVDSSSGLSVKVKGVSLPNSSDNTDAFGEDSLFLEDVPLTKENYCRWMSKP